MSEHDKMPDETTCRRWAEDIAAATREFTANPYWKRIYDNAPEGAKVRLALSFCYSERHGMPDFIYSDSPSCVRSDPMYCSTHSARSPAV